MELKLTNNYWDHKFWSYMHDPFDKAFDIKGHVKRAKELCEIFGLEPPNENFWKKADSIASGFERGQIVSYHKEESKSGAIDFLKNPIITHPTGEKAHLSIKLPQNITPDNTWSELKKFIQKDIGMKPGEGGYSENFIGDNERFSIARFLYAHLILRFRLAQENIGDIGALWHRLPADTRFPDHSIWQHNALVSAIQSCFELGENENDLGLMVFSITPVQGFIAKARKLRDYWTGSILLSWLSFEGIKWIIENLGPDHIIYPSLIDQYLVNEYLAKKWKINRDFFMNNESKIASFPNKFLFLIPFSKSHEIASKIEKKIREGWKNLKESVYEYLLKLLKEKLDETNKKYLKNIFDRQNENFWDLNWAAVKLITKDEKNEIKKLLPKQKFENQFKLLEKFLKMIEDKDFFEKSGIGTLYSVSHSLCQSALAVNKLQKKVLRNAEPGEKCQMCGEFEVLHYKDCSNKSASDYKKHIKEFWNFFNNEWKNEVDFKENERLCSVCFIKRVAYKVLQEKEDHILNSTFKNTRYESTTEIALFDFFERNKNLIENIAKSKDKSFEEIKKDIAQSLYEADDRLKKEYGDLSKDLKIKDLYFAILLMDGDNMGKLINGETIASTWASVMHPVIYNKLINGSIDEKYSKLWNEIFDKLPYRNVTSAIHLSISEALGDFAVYGVANIVKKYNGKLIYAGGDDICTVLPVDYAIQAANEIQKYYKSSFRLIFNNGESEEIIDEFSPIPGKLSVNLGKGENISISAGILICHHKENLSQMIKTAHTLLDVKAKQEGGRDAVAVQLRKRSGGDRYFVSKWDSEEFQAFIELSNEIGENVSPTFAYKLNNFKDGLEALLKKDKEYLKKFILNQLDKSGIKSENKEKLAENISKIIFWDNKFNNDPLIIAGFLSKKEETNEKLV